MNSFEASAQMYKELVGGYRDCQDTDTLLSTSFMAKEDGLKLKKLISQVKKEIKQEKGVKLAKKVMSMFQEKNQQDPSNTEESEEKENIADCDNTTGAVAGAGDTAAAGEAQDKKLDSLVEAEASLHDKLLPRQEAKELIEKTIALIKSVTHKQRDHFLTNYSGFLTEKDKLMLLEVKVTEVNGEVGGNSEEEEEIDDVDTQPIAQPSEPQTPQATPTKTPEKEADSVKEAKNNMKLDVCSSALEEIEAMLTKTPGTPQTPADVRSKMATNLNGECGFYLPSLSLDKSLMALLIILVINGEILHVFNDKLE